MDDHTMDEASREDWKRLVDAAVRIKQLSPWEWMDEDEIFGIRHPDSSEIGFISVMGGLGEHTAVAVYLGTEALARFMELQQAPPDVLDEYPELLMEVPQLQASFEDRGDLEDWDRQLLRNLGMKFRGRKAWPLFQSFRPGFMPWRLEPEEVRYLTLAIEQLEQVAPRVEESHDFLLGEEPGTFLIRSCRAPAGKAAVWEDRYETVPEPVSPLIPLAWNPDDVKKLKRASPSGDVIELDFFMFPGRIGDKDQRPQAGYVLLAVHAQSNLVFGVEMLAVTDSFEHMLGCVPGWILSRLAEPGMRPKKIHVQSERLIYILRPAFQELGTKIVFKPRLKKLRAAKREMFAFFAKGPRP
jgi:hypothetical protein